MALQGPFKLLEINIISAQDLPPVSKMLRTFAVAYVHPDQKLTTRIDHQGHTNPTWNYKVSFHVDEKFLKQESSAVTIEIYNLAWLRDLPIGTAHLLINNLSPPLNKNPAFRRVALQICRPSGHLQGTLNVGVQLIDNTTPGSDEPSFYPIITSDEEKMEEYFQDEEKIPGSVGICTTPDSRILTCRPETESEPEPEPEHEPEPEIKTNTSSGSLFSMLMKPLPTEVADDLKKGIYSPEWNEYGSSIFEGWTEDGDKSEDREVESREVQQWLVEDQIPFTTDTKQGCHRPKRSGGGGNKKKGMFSCFGNAYGMQFSLIWRCNGP